MTTSNPSSNILRPYRTLEKNGVSAIEWTDGLLFSGIKFTISEVNFKNDENGAPLLYIDYVLHDQRDFEGDEKKQFEDELSEFVFGLILFGKMKADEEGIEDETRTNDPEQSNS